MTSVFSSTYDSKYDFFIPITSWAWGKLGIKSICIMPEVCTTDREYPKFCLFENTIEDNKLPLKLYYFRADKDKQPTYSQISRLYAASVVQNNEVLISTDVDMLVFKNIFEQSNGMLWNIGEDLVPDSQLPVCYTWGEAWHWDYRFDIRGKSLQECLDEQLANENCQHMRGNLWSRDQELLRKAFEKNNYDSTVRLLRARPGTQFASHRLDRDDAFLIDRLDPDIFDYHMPRPGYEDVNFNQILAVLKYFYPNENFNWLVEYREKYMQLL